MARRLLGPATLAAVQAVRTALTEHDRSLLVACSGGADSLALAVAVSQEARGRTRTVAAVVVDHGLQPDSAAVAERAADQLRRIGLTDVEVARVTVDRESRTGPEAAARDARGQVLRARAADRSAVVLLGHTLDDQAETVLLGLARGSGTRSLAGMATRSGQLVRPFLGLRRRDTEAVCGEAGLAWWTDPHNGDQTYARVRVRDRALPLLEAELGPGIADALARTARLARDDADLLDALAERVDPGTATLPCAELAALPPALRGRVLRRWLTRQGAVDVGYAHLVEVDRLVTDWHGQRALDLPGVTLTREDGELSCR